MFIVNPRPFITVDLTPEGKLPGKIIPRGCDCVYAHLLMYLHCLKQRVTTQSKWQPYSVSFVNNGTMQSSTTSLIGKVVQNENLRDLTVQNISCIL